MIRPMRILITGDINRPGQDLNILRLYQRLAMPLREAFGCDVHCHTADPLPFGDWVAGYEDGPYRVPDLLGGKTKADQDAFRAKGRESCRPSAISLGRKPALEHAHSVRIGSVLAARPWVSVLDRPFMTQSGLPNCSLSRVGYRAAIKSRSGYDLRP
jgi:hypothetical protein